MAPLDMTAPILMGSKQQVLAWGFQHGSDVAVLASEGGHSRTRNKALKSPSTEQCCCGVVMFL